MAPALIHQPPRAIGYVRVSTAEQADSGLGMAAQRAAIEAEAERRGWRLELVQETASAGSLRKRPLLQAALDRLDRHEADVLVVAKLDRLSRSVAQGAEAFDRARRKSWSVVVLDWPDLDTTSAAGEMVANSLLNFAQYERRRIGERTRDALAAKKAAGVRLGRPQTLSGDVVAHIVGLRRDGVSFRRIAEQLEAAGVPTARGGATWHASSVKAVCESQAAADLA